MTAGAEVLTGGFLFNLMSFQLKKLPIVCPKYCAPGNPQTLAIFVLSLRYT
jgi:hypothetical protein